MNISIIDDDRIQLHKYTAYDYSIPYDLSHDWIHIQHDTSVGTAIFHAGCKNPYQTYMWYGLLSTVGKLTNNGFIYV